MQTDAEWLADLFRFEWCGECGGGERHHTVVPFMGNPFARCDYPPDADGRQNIIIAAYRDGLATGQGLDRPHIPGTDYYDGRDGSIEAEDDDEDRIAEQDALMKEVRS